MQTMLSRMFLVCVMVTLLPAAGAEETSYVVTRTTGQILDWMAPEVDQKDDLLGALDEIERKVFPSEAAFIGAIETRLGESLDPALRPALLEYSEQYLPNLSALEMYREEEEDYQLQLVEHGVARVMGTLATVGNRASSPDAIHAAEFRLMLDEYIPAERAQSSVLVLTQCFGGSMLHAFEGRARTTVLSATSPGHFAHYGGYHLLAARALKPAPGGTTDDVHGAGLGTKEAERPRKQGEPAPLDPVSPDGPIKSRHILFYAGEPEDRDEADRLTIIENFAQETGTTVTMVGGAVGRPGYHYPGNRSGLRASLKTIGAKMNEDEQFILFVGDHGGQIVDVPAPRAVAPGGKVTVVAEVPASTLEAMARNKGGAATSGVQIALAGTETVMRNTVHVTLPGSSAPDRKHPVARAHTVYLDGKAATRHPLDGQRLYIRITYDDLLAGSRPGSAPGARRILLAIHNRNDFPLAMASVAILTGTVERL